MNALQTFEEQIAALIAEHDLASLTIATLRGEDGHVWANVTAQAIHNGVRICHANATFPREENAPVSKLIGSAIANLNAARGSVVDVPELACAA